MGERSLALGHRCSNHQMNLPDGFCTVTLQSCSVSGKGEPPEHFAIMTANMYRIK